MQRHTISRPKVCIASRFCETEVFPCSDTPFSAKKPVSRKGRAGPSAKTPYLRMAAAKSCHSSVKLSFLRTNGTFGPIDHLNSFPGGGMYHESVFSWYIGSDRVSRYFPGVQGGAISVELPALTAVPCAECSPCSRGEDSWFCPVLDSRSSMMSRR